MKDRFRCKTKVRYRLGSGHSGFRSYRQVPARSGHGRLRDNVDSGNFAAYVRCNGCCKLGR